MSYPITSSSLFGFSYSFFPLLDSLFCFFTSIPFFPSPKSLSVFSLFSMHLFLSLLISYPSLVLSLFVRVEHEHHYYMFKHLTKGKIHLQLLQSYAQEHGKAFTITLKQSDTENSRGWFLFSFMNDQTKAGTQITEYSDSHSI